MIEVTLEGDSFTKIAKAFCNDGRTGCDIDKLYKWKVPLKFKQDSIILHQPRPGPCGLFASLQAQIIKHMVLSEGKSENDSSLALSIVDIMDLIQENKYSFCTMLSYQQKKAVFQTTDSRDKALSFLLESQYADKDDSCLLLAFSFVYVASFQEWFNSLKAPFVYDDMNTSMQFVFLMVSGRIDGQSPKQKQIALRVVHNSISELNKYWLNEGATIVVFLHGQIHFFAVMKDEGNGLIFDSLGDGKIKSIPFDQI